MKHTIKRVWNAATTLLIALVLLLVVLLWGFRLFGYEVLIVQSGSMEPAYHVGALVYTKPVDARELQVGDVITFELGGGVRGTHRITEVLEDEGGLAFRTKGDSNEEADATPVLAEAIVGEVKFTVPYLGFFVTYIQQPSGRLVAIGAAALLLLLIVLSDFLFPADKKQNKQERSE